MRSILMSAALLTTLALANTASAGHAGGHPASSGHSNHTISHNSYGTKFSGGHYYSGRNWNHWTYQCYSSRYGCNCFYCPYTYAWYYWCQPSNCFYPVSYYNSAPPVLNANVNVNTNTNTNTNANVPAGPGMVALGSGPGPIPNGGPTGMPIRP